MVEMLNTIGGPRRVLVLVLPLARLLAWAAILCMVVAAGLGGYWLSAGTDAVQRLWAPAAVASHEADQSVIDMPELIANLRKDTPSRYLKIGLSLAVAPADRARVEKAMPQLKDALQEFLRNLDQDDLEGSAGLHRLRTEIKRRFNLIASEPNSNRDAVADVLLRSLLTQ